MYSHLFPYRPGTKKTFEDLAKAVEEIVYKYPHVGYLVLVFQWLGGNANEVLRHREHICINQQKFGIECSSFLLFKNRFANKPMSPRVEEQFLNAFLGQAIADSN
jgi:hypothetical protein